jgi:NADH-quinone oxidoreductase subunit H
MLYILKLFFFFKNEDYLSYFDLVIYTLLTLLPLIVTIAFFTLAERKVIASIQRRKGPNMVGVWGFLQPFADGLKLIVKEILIPNTGNRVLFLGSSGLTLFLSFLGWLAIPFSPLNPIFSLNTSLLYVLVISAISVYGVLLAGWASNSKFAVLGSLRSVSQIISYEVSITLAIIPIILFSGSINLAEIVQKQTVTTWFIFPLFPIAVIFFISMLAETNRTPFDLPEAEAELVSGYNVEFAAFTFAAFFLGEYANILLMSSVFVTVFLGGGDWWVPDSWNQSFFIATVFYDFIYSFKIVFICFLVVFMRANLPRFRFDQLMFIGWKIMLPLTISLIFFYSIVLFSLDGLSVTQVPRIGSTFNYIGSNSVRF